MFLSYPRVFCIVAVYNRKDITLSFVEMIRKQNYDNTYLFVVDDMSTDGTYEYLKDLSHNYSKLKILRTNGNAWWGGCMYIGIEHILKNYNPSDNYFVLFMNDDITFSDSLITSFVYNSILMPDAVLAATPLHGNRIRSIGSSIICWPFSIPYSPYRGREVSSNAIPEFMSIDFQYAHATLYPIKIIKVIGNIAYRDLPHYHGDGEYSYRAKKSGFKSYVVKSIWIYPDTKSTGLFNSFLNQYSFLDLFKSYTSIKSINNLKHRWAFAKLCCPAIWRPFYFCSEVIKATLRSLLIIMHSRLNKI